jgi:hypothetical protein
MNRGGNVSLTVIKRRERNDAQLPIGGGAARDEEGSRQLRSSELKISRNASS